MLDLLKGAEGGRGHTPCAEYRQEEAQLKLIIPRLWEGVSCA